LYPRVSDIHLDLASLWCGAAKDFNPNRTSCMLVPLISTRMTRRPQWKMIPAVVETTRMNETTSTNNIMLQRWLGTVESHWKPMVRRVRLSQIKKSCLKLNHRKAFNLTKCGLYMGGHGGGDHEMTNIRPAAVTDCGCGDHQCNSSVLDLLGGQYSCKRRINYVMGTGQSEIEACTSVSSEFPSICGQGCDPRTCRST
jgi:hypothetical protein